MGRAVYDFEKDGLARVYDEGKWYLINRAYSQVGDNYDYIEAWGEGYYKVERGVRKNLMRPDGSLVLKEWYHNIFPVKHGFFEFGNTIRKSKQNPMTKYPCGLAHVSGIVVLPMIFDHTQWLEKEDGIYAEIDKKPYILTLDGSVFDPTFDHLPPRQEVNREIFYEKWINWVLPGLQLFYRDTDAMINVDETYHVGDTLHAGRFIDVTTKLWKPAHRIRFLIASAHAALFCEEQTLLANNPEFEEWGLCTLHYDSYFKVLDIYKVNGVTQIFLLHVPPASVKFFKNQDLTMLMHCGEDSFNLVETAHQSLDSKMRMEVHPRSLNKTLMDRMSHPVGLDDHFHPCSLKVIGEDVPKDLKVLSNVIHRMSEDQDIEGFLETVYDFPYHGIDDSICQGCIYANGITNKADRCGCLLKEQFRQNYVKGECEHKKTSLNVLSKAEQREHDEIKKEGLVAAKQTDAFALKLVRDFVREKLDGDINRLIDFDFHSLFHENYSEDKYASCSGYAFSPEKTKIVRAIASLVFGEAWNDLSYHNIEKGRFSIEFFNPFFLQFGAAIGIEWGEKIFKGLNRHEPSKELIERVYRYYLLHNSIGNVVVLPSMLSREGVQLNLSRAKRKWREYPDSFLMEIYDELVNASHTNIYLKAEYFSNEKVYVNCKTREGFQTMIKALLLEDYVNENGVPMEVFRTKCSFDRSPDRTSYLEGVNELLDFCEKEIPKRAKQIVYTLKTILENK